MTRCERRMRLVASWGGAWFIMLGLLATPASATVSCSAPKSSDCANVLPIATTTDATNVESTDTIQIEPITSTTATLNGVTGPGVSNGPTTQYFFQYGTSTAYGTTGPTGTIGGCPPGVAGGAYCAVPPVQYVHYNITGLDPCSTYHFRIVASNTDGTTDGLDRTFATEFSKPIQYVHAPKRVKHRTRFRVRIGLGAAATITIQLRRDGKTVKTYHKGFRKIGQVTQRIRAPKRTGKYTIKVIATEPCGKETLAKTFTVT